MRLLRQGYIRLLALGLTLSVLLPAANRPGHAENFSARLEILWSTPITTEITNKDMFGRSEGLVLGAGAMAPDGKVVFVGDRLGGGRPGRVLLSHAEKAGPDAAVLLELPGPTSSGAGSIGTWLLGKQKLIRNPAVMSLGLVTAGVIWLGGYSNSYTGMASDVHRDAYLAKLDEAGRLVWERSYGEGRWLDIESIAPSAEGGVVGVGRDWNSSWLARIAGDGALMAERRFGNGKGAVVVPMRDSRFLIAGFTSEGQGDTYRDGISTWVLDDAGDMHGPTRVREALNRMSGAYYGKIAASAADDGAYVASNWNDPSRPEAVEVARVSSDGAPLWRRALPNTISQEATQAATFSTCDPTLATLSNGDALVACALDGKIQLYRLNHETGQQSAALLPLPECQRAHPATLFLMARRDGTLFLGGSRPGSNVAASCSWLGRLSIEAQ